MAINVGISDFVDDPTSLTAEFARAVEAFGFNALGIRDHQSDGRDPFIRLAIAALNTSKLTVYPAVSNPLTRHWSVLASLCNTLQELAPGRFKLILGGGDIAAKEMGRKGASLGEMRTSVLSIQKLLAGNAVQFNDNDSTEIINGVDNSTPVLINASSPKMIELAGEIADGAMLMVGLDKDIVNAAHKLIETGARHAGRLPQDIPVTYMVPVYMDVSREKAQERSKFTLYMWLKRKQRLFTRILAETGMVIPLIEQPEHIPSYLIPKLSDAMGLVGTPEQCGERLQQFLEETGARQVHFLVYSKENHYESVLTNFEKFILPYAK